MKVSLCIIFKSVYTLFSHLTCICILFPTIFHLNIMYILRSVFLMTPTILFLKIVSINLLFKSNLFCLIIKLFFLKLVILTIIISKKIIIITASLNFEKHIKIAMQNFIEKYFFLIFQLDGVLPC